MLPVFGNERRRQINLGGSHSVSSQSSLLDAAKLRREERLEHKRRSDNAVRVQAWWRGIREAQLVRRELRVLFFQDITGITALRCLVLLQTDQEALGMWSAAMNAQGDEILFQHALGPSRESWLILIRQICLRLLQSVAASPQSQFAPSHLQVLWKVLSGEGTSRALGPDNGKNVTGVVLQYVLEREFYRLLSKAIRSIPVQSKNSPSLPIIIQLLSVPFSTFSSDSASYRTSLHYIFTEILSIPLLPNRLPLPSITYLSMHFPLANLHLLGDFAPLELEPSLHLVANLLMFTPPRYSKLSPLAIGAYLDLLSSLLNAMPVNALDPVAKSKEVSAALWANQDSDEESDGDGRRTRVSVVSTFNPEPEIVLPDLDARTLKRLSTLPTPKHLVELIQSSKSPTLVLPISRFIIALASVWPSKRDSIFTVTSNPGLVRGLYREYVRGSVLGKEGHEGAVMDPANATVWPALLLLVHLYSQALVTMGDDEFFGTRTGATALRNPLTLDELISLSRQLLNIAFVLYAREEQSDLTMKKLEGLRYTWVDVREKVTGCLLGIHARDSRRPFVPKDHWLVSSRLDMQSFVEAAVFEEQNLSFEEADEPVLPAARLQRNPYISKRQLATMSPRLGVLNNIPFAIPFEVRVTMFRHFVLNDIQKRRVSATGFLFLGGNNRYTYNGRSNRTHVSVRRGNIAQDGFDKLAEVDLKAPVEITFIDQFGEAEAGIDGGGVFKEFFTELCKEVFDTDRGLWLATKKNELYPNPHGYATEPHSLNWYRFIGRILGKAMYEGILVDVAFAGFFLAKWLGKQSFLDDLQSLDPELYNGLVFLKHYDGNPEDLSLNFTAAIDEFGETKLVDLVPNGSNIPVTRENRLQYIQLISHFRLSKQIRLQSEAFFEGLMDMIDPKWLRMFNQQEVQILIGGVNAPVDLDDLRSHTNYGGLYDDHEPTIQSFWNVVNSFGQEDRQRLLRFVTSCSRPPLLGFKELNPNFCIRDAGTDQHRLPTSSTCVNLLKLPRYQSEKVLKQKLLQAINAGAGFDLS
ncbi:HECT-domain-containing protein [Mycena floridula]|nr:HECT-domain-containing protein [Mycena floridula]